MFDLYRIEPLTTSTFVRLFDDSSIARVKHQPLTVLGSTTPEGLVRHRHTATRLEQVFDFVSAVLYVQAYGRE
jgi:hypothetical protein